jgi:hypothetical protein
MEERFELERFEWQAPDRLEVAGRFHGLEKAPAEKPVLVVSGGGAERRLNAVDEVPAEDGQAWRAQFVWDEPPVGVEAAALELGPDIVVDLPPPGAPKTVLQPRSPQPGDVALQADLLAAEQEVQELRSALERTQAELDRARSDVEGERSGRAADAERFREGLAQVRASAEQAVAAAEAEVDALQQRLSAFEGVGTEAGELHADAQRLLARVTKLVDVLDGK